MRIIAGEFRGRLLVEPRFDTTRPITDRAKQSLFDILSPILEDAVVYDCFCGTGSMGLECLSRGARHATFFDMDRHALAGLKKNIETLGVQDRAKIMAGDIFKFFPPPLEGGGRGRGPQGSIENQPALSTEETQTPRRESWIRDSRRGVGSSENEVDQTLQPLPPPRQARLPARGGEEEISLLFFDPPYPFLRQKPHQLVDLMTRLLHHRLAPDATILFRHDTADALTLPGLIQTDLRTYGGMAIEILRPANPANEPAQAE